MTCDEIIEAVTNLYNDVSDTVSVNLNDKKLHGKWIIIF